MTRFEETTLNNGAQNAGMNTPKKKEGNATWKSVTIGGLTGIFFGVASSIGANTYMAVKRGEKAAEAENAQDKTAEEAQENAAALENEQKDGVAKATVKETPKANHTAKAGHDKGETTPSKPEGDDTDDPNSVDNNNQEHKVDEETSFADAFQTAREAKGPGSLFVWNGKVCTTYTEEEWNSLTDEQREEFAMNARMYTEEGAEDPMPDNIKDSTGDIAQTDVKDDDVEEATLMTDDQKIKETITEDGQILSAQSDVKDSTGQPADDDVQIIGTKTVTLPNGQVADMAHVKMHDEDVAVIDMDQDGVADIAMADLNHNGTPDEGEIVDLHTKEVISAGAFAQSQSVQPETDPSVGAETGYDPNVNDAPVADDGSEYFTI